MSSPDSLDELINRTQQRIDHLDRLAGSKPMAKQPLGARLSSHLAKHGNLVVNAALAGCVFAVAWGQLRQKYEHQGKMQDKEQQLAKALAENRRLQDRVQRLEHSIGRLGDDVRQELDKGGWRLSPVAQRLRSLLGEEGTPVGTAAAASPADSGHSRRPPVPMI